MFLACMFSYVIRTNLSITIVAMVNATSKDGAVGPACTMDLRSNKTVVIKDVSYCVTFNLLILQILHCTLWSHCCKHCYTSVVFM